MQDSQGQITALAFRCKSLTPVKVFYLRSEADLLGLGGENGRVAFGAVPELVVR